MDEVEQLMQNQDWNSRRKHKLIKKFDDNLELLGDAQRIEQIALSVFQSFIQLGQLAVQKITIEVSYNTFDWSL